MFTKLEIWRNLDRHHRARKIKIEFFIISIVILLNDIFEKDDFFNSTNFV